MIKNIFSTEQLQQRTTTKNTLGYKCIQRTKTVSIYTHKLTFKNIFSTEQLHTNNNRKN